LWHYAYQIFNGDYYGTPTNKDDDYHLGYVYDSDVTVNLADKINKFSLSILPIDSTQGPSDLTVVGRTGSEGAYLGTTGSTGGGGVWSVSIDPGEIGLDWVISGSTGYQIAPAMWNYNKHGSQWTWDKLYAGDRSTGDETINGTAFKFFEITSMGAPVEYEAALGVGAYDDAQGVVMGPDVIPEPATIAILALGGLLLKRRK
jgi:hypothetical protein